MNNTMSNSEFANHMVMLAKTAQPFRPTATYDPDGDCIEFLASPDPFYAERVDDLVTVYYSQETNEVIGSLIKGVSKFYKQILTTMPGFRIEVHDGPVKLEHLFLARIWSSEYKPSDVATLTYRKLIDVSRETKVEGELCLN